MTWLAGATKKPLGKQTQPRMTHHDIICVHTMVGYLTSTERMFREQGFTGTESHVGIGGKWGPDQPAGLDGAVWQFQDTDFTADANLEGSWHVLSIETADNAPARPDQILLWTPKQQRSLVAVIVAWCQEYDIPPVLIPDTKPGRRGLAYHYQGVPPNLVNGGELWSKAGHVCPGPVRVRQFVNDIIPRVQVALALKTQSLEDDVKWTDRVPLTAEDARVWNLTAPKGTVYKQGDTVAFSDMVRYPTLARKTDLEVQALAKQAAALEAQSKANGSALSALGLKLDQILALNTLKASPKPTT